MTSTLDHAAIAFRDWRSTRASRGRTPDHLRTMAISLVGRYPNGQICERLKINARALKTWAGTQDQPTEFVSLASSNIIEASPAEPRSPELTLKLNCQGVELQLSGALEADFIMSLVSAVKMEGL